MKRKLRKPTFFDIVVATRRRRVRQSGSGIHGKTKFDRESQKSKDRREIDKYFEK